MLYVSQTIHDQSASLNTACVLQRLYYCPEICDPEEILSKRKRTSEVNADLGPWTGRQISHFQFFHHMFRDCNEACKTGLDSVVN